MLWLSPCDVTIWWLSAKISRTSVPPVKEEEVIKFKLVEDIRLVTIPITSCLCVLLSYLAFGAILFAHWEVRLRLKACKMRYNISQSE